jgi:uncharacterized protein YraI
MHYNRCELIRKMRKIISFFLIVFTALVSFLQFSYASANNLFQQPTIAIPTVTGTPKGVTATVLLNQEESINVRSGPGVFFDKVGVLLPGQEAAVIGRSAGGDWILIDYPGGPENKGWIYAPVVQISPGELPIIEPPPTPTPAQTQTINPTLAAQFINTPNPTRLPTFTPAEPLVVPTYSDMTTTSFLGGIPMGLVILVIAGLGGLLAIFSVVKSR